MEYSKERNCLLKHAICDDFRFIDLMLRRIARSIFAQRMSQRVEPSLPSQLYIKFARHSICSASSRLATILMIRKPGELTMANKVSETTAVTREKLIELLNDDLEREYQAIIAYVVYSQVIKGAQYMNIAQELEKHAGEELQHALTIAKQIDYLGGMPKATPKPVKISDKAEEMLRFDLDSENETVQNYRQRLRQCEALGEFAIAEHIRDILMQEQEHQIDLANALGIDVPDVNKTSGR